ncbi:hypothetical protein ANO11243_033630 [Dothideomycetidae sp. 11243]|nr:hypothetical protein ANO11243_033630 [fungal sp. No.11243]
MAGVKVLDELTDLSAKVILVTGATAGLGRQTLLAFAAAGSPRLFFTGRSSESAQKTVEACKAVNKSVSVTFQKCDLTDLAAVKAAAKEIISQTDRLDVVFCNAGVMAIPAAVSKDGFEIQFATNHLGHAMLVQQLLPVLERTARLPNADVRVVFNTSQGYQFAYDIDYDTIRTKQEAYILGAFKRYGQSKLANIFYPKELARRYPQITFVSIHPGVINSGLFSGLSTFNRYFTEATTFWKQVTIEEGVQNQLWAAAVPKTQISNGAYYEPVGQLGVLTAAGSNKEMATELYEWTEKTLSDY